MGLLAPLQHPFGAFPKHALWLMLSFAVASMKVSAKDPIAGWNRVRGWN
jgi:hypothetical protein